MDEVFKAAAYAWEAYSDTKIAHSGEPDETALAKALGFKETVWSYFSRPEEQFRRTRFGIGMRGVAAFQPADAVLNCMILTFVSKNEVLKLFLDYNWKALPAGSLVVDVGGGIGSVTYTIAKNFPDIHFVVQDLPTVIEDGKKVWPALAALTIETKLSSGGPQIFQMP